MSDALVHITPYDGFAFGNSRTNDLCVRTASTQQRVIVSPAKTDMTDLATLTVGQTDVEVAGHLLAAGSVVSADIGTAGLRLRRPNASDAGTASHAWNEPVRLRIGSVTSSILNYKLYDVVIIKDMTSNTTSYSLICGPSINGRRFVVKNALANDDVIINVLALDGMTSIRTVDLLVGAEISFFGHMDVWF